MAFHVLPRVAGDGGQPLASMWPDAERPAVPYECMAVSSTTKASLEHLDEAERSWDKFVAESGMKVRGYPTLKQVLM